MKLEADIPEDKIISRCVEWGSDNDWDFEARTTSAKAGACHVWMARFREKNPLTDGKRCK